MRHVDDLHGVSRQRDFIEEILPGKYTVFNKFSAAILQEGSRN